MGEVLPLPGLGSGLPARPDPAVVPFLDAACRAVERFGWSRTTMRDIAREAGVERTTVYRHVGSMGDVYRSMVAHEAHKLVEAIPAWIPAGADGPATVVEVLASAVEYCLDHPVLAKVVADEPDVVTSFLHEGVPSVIDLLADLLAPVVVAAMDAGRIARHDPVVITQWAVRIGLSLLIAPPPGELRPFLEAVLRPALAVPSPVDPLRGGAR